jgi:hypothetical protein
VHSVSPLQGGLVVVATSGPRTEGFSRSLKMLFGNAVPWVSLLLPSICWDNIENMKQVVTSELRTYGCGGDRCKVTVFGM